MALGTHPQNYTLGRGEIYFARFAPGTQTPVGERYIGNTPEFALTIEQEQLEHFSSDRGVREKDDSVALQVNRTGNLTTDNIVPDNVALFFFGDKSTVAEAGGAEEETLTDVEQGLYYQLGITDERPTGAAGILSDEDSNSDANFAVYTLGDSNSDAEEFVRGTDYEVDFTLGRLYIIPGGGIADGTDITVEYNVRASSFERVISGSQPVEGALRYVELNPKGQNKVYYMPWVQISPNGDYALKSDEWQTIPFSIEVLKKSGREAIYCDNRPVFA